MPSNTLLALDDLDIEAIHVVEIPGIADSLAAGHSMPETGASACCSIVCSSCCCSC
ncbi:thiomuracin/GE37468 family thiazolyl RiPP peptide [Nonomuraea jiangxiensis]|uniref:Uncharacterized protein n=1 Tax=Nonomuraea jiangxiensis TaxID=633440 RepID=A0A1G8RZ40_9ACTN|nr:thiomuracin/GE37468 family thiazolyl RiPP peptide [Nonomuraea jiangxiensis]SDJ22238.1 hypothetical protein SAMN05421869_109229 [Nonomuraea jiangxiensis]